MMGWRDIIDAACRDGDQAEAALSAKALKAALALSPERRAALLDQGEDLRLKDMTEADRSRLRQSLGGLPGSAAIAAKEAWERRRQVAVLTQYVAAYDQQLLAIADELVAALAAVFHDADKFAVALIRAVRHGGSSPCLPRRRWWVSSGAQARAEAAVAHLITLGRGRAGVLAQLREIDHGKV